MEIARIMGGINITDKLIETAGEMLDEAPDIKAVSESETSAGTTIGAQTN